MLVKALRAPIKAELTSWRSLALIAASLVAIRAMVCRLTSGSWHWSIICTSTWGMLGKFPETFRLLSIACGSVMAVHRYGAEVRAKKGRDC